MTVTSPMTMAQITVTILMTVTAVTTNKIIFVGTTVTALDIFFFFLLKLPFSFMEC
jgi:hypothetical protein